MLTLDIILVYSDDRTYCKDQLLSVRVLCEVRKSNGQNGRKVSEVVQKKFQ